LQSLNTDTFDKKLYGQKAVKYGQKKYLNNIVYSSTKIIVRLGFSKDRFIVLQKTGVTGLN
jgi:hypothetical protein